MGWYLVKHWDNFTFTFDTRFSYLQKLLNSAFGVQRLGFYVEVESYRA